MWKVVIALTERVRKKIYTAFTEIAEGTEKMNRKTLSGLMRAT